MRKGKVSADAGHDSGVEKPDIDGSDNEKIQSHRNGQDDDQSGQGAHYDGCNAYVCRASI